MKKEETTSKLDCMLKDVHTEKQAEEFISEHISDSANRSFREYLIDYATSSTIEMSEIINRSQLNKNYVYNIINGVTKRPGRDKVLALCIGAGMNRKETDRALKLAGHNPLYPKDERDTRIIICLNNGMENVLNVNLYLEQHNIQLIEI